MYQRGVRGGNIYLNETIPVVWILTLAERYQRKGRGPAKMHPFGSTVTGVSRRRVVHSSSLVLYFYTLVATGTLHQWDT
jgi:hypothetical protein